MLSARLLSAKTSFASYTPEINIQLLGFFFYKNARNFEKNVGLPPSQRLVYRLYLDIVFP